MIMHMPPKELKLFVITAPKGALNILRRVDHPQTNGKIERFYETFQSKIQHFNSMEEFVIWYNTKRPYMSLNWDQLETPVQAFYEKIDRRRNQLPFIINNLR